MENISEADAKVKAEKAIINVGLNPGSLININLTKDVETNKNIYVLNYAGAEVHLEPTKGKVLSLRDTKDHINIAKNITTRDQAKGQAGKLYAELQESEDLTPGYKLVGIEQPVSDDFWMCAFQKEIISGVFSQYEEIKITFDASGKLVIFNEFNTPVRSSNVIITKEQAIGIVNSKFNSNGSNSSSSSNDSNGYSVKLSDLHAYDARLQVVKTNNMAKELFPVFSGQPDNQEPFVTLAWVVNISPSTKVLYVDANKGEVIGGNQVK